MPLWASLLLWGPLLLLGTQIPLDLCSHLACPQGHLCHHSRKGQRSFLLSHVHHSARPPHLLQTGMCPGHCSGAKAQSKLEPWALAKMKQPVFCTPKHIRIENLGCW